MKNKITFSILLLSLATSLAFADECERFGVSPQSLETTDSISQIPEVVMANYQQPRLMTEDILGDYSLLEKAHSTPRNIFFVVVKKPEVRDTYFKNITNANGCAKELFESVYNQADQEIQDYNISINNKDIQTILNSNLSPEKKTELISQITNHKLYLEGHKQPIKEKLFLEMVGQIIQEGLLDGITPTIGTPHGWSSQFKKTLMYRTSVMAKFSKLLIALARGETSQYMVSGTEQDLKQWILTQEEASIDLHDMLAKSYRLNNGDMYLSILTIENVLSRSWRVPNRQLLPLTRRLKPIINSFGREGDTFGSWYHLFGVMLYGYAEGGLKSRVAGSIEAMGSAILSHFEDEQQETYINSIGGIIGAKIAKMIKKKEYLEMEYDSSKLDRKYYLDLNEDFSDRLSKIP